MSFVLNARAAPRMIPTSPCGMTSCRPSPNISTISAVHGPTPLIAVSASRTSSSARRPSRRSGASARKDRAQAWTQAAFEADRPAPRSWGNRTLASTAGVKGMGASASRRCMIAPAAVREICWPAIATIRELKGRERMPSTGCACARATGPRWRSLRRKATAAATSRGAIGMRF